LARRQAGSVKRGRQLAYRAEPMRDALFDPLRCHAAIFTDQEKKLDHRHGIEQIGKAQGRILGDVRLAAQIAPHLANAAQQMQC